MTDNKITTAIAQAYSEKFSSPEDAVSAALNVFTQEQVSGAQMLSGHMQGNFLKLMSMMIQPQNVIELGTYTGYATIALAAGLKDGGKVYTIDTDSQLQPVRDKYWEEAGLSKQIEQRIGKAVDVLPSLDNIIFDLAFIDADKGNYQNYTQYLLDRMPVGGIILADNTLFHGDVFEEPIVQKTAIKINQFNEYLQNLDNIFHVLLPIRDGITLIRKMK